MKLKVFSRVQSPWTGTLKTIILEQEVNRWLAAHSSIKVMEVKHDLAAGFWSWPQFIISIYYTEDANEKSTFGAVPVANVNL